LSTSKFNLFSRFNLYQCAVARPIPIKEFVRDSNGNLTVLVINYSSNKTTPQTYSTKKTDSLESCIFCEHTRSVLCPFLSSSCVLQGCHTSKRIPGQEICGPIHNGVNAFNASPHIVLCSHRYWHASIGARSLRAYADSAGTTVEQAARVGRLPQSRRASNERNSPHPVLFFRLRRQKKRRRLPAVLYKGAPLHRRGKQHCVAPSLRLNLFGYLQCSEFAAELTADGACATQVSRAPGNRSAQGSAIPRAPARSAFARR
jgi:hypothetical protein